MYGVFTTVETMRSLPVGKSLTEVTPIDIEFGVESRSTPPLAVPPSSFTWRVKLEVRRAVGIRRRDELEVAARDVVLQDELALNDRQVVIDERAGGRQRRDLSPQPDRWPANRSVGQREVAELEDIGIVFERRDGPIGADRLVC